MTHEALEIAESPEAAANACAAWILEELRNAVSVSGRARIAISGGSTPNVMFDTLGKTPFDWSNVHIFWVDERCVPPTDPRSNFKAANERFLQPASVPAANIHRIQGELSPTDGAALYLKDIQTHFEISAGLPEFDIVHRGMGPDAHTASLFPGEPLINDRKNVVAAVYVKKLDMHRVTLLPGVLLAARKTVMLVAGDDKAEALRNVLRGPDDPLRFPCQLGARNSPRALWFLDRAASARL
jgi:6-phosphogluconolactonase